MVVDSPVEKVALLGHSIDLPGGTDLASVSIIGCAISV